MFEYRYNHQNLRVEKIKKQLSGRDPGYPTTPGTNPGAWNPVETRNYIWDGWNIVAEIIIDHVNSATNISYYTWGLDLSGTLQGAGGVGGLLCDTKVKSSETNTYFAVGDANGNITEYVDVSGTIAAHGEHNAFGETKFSGAMKDEFTHWSSTKPFDKETGFVVYQRRYYDPILCWWLSRDPIGVRGGNNLYLLGNNDVINKWDYLGLIEVTIITDITTEDDLEAWKLVVGKAWIINGVNSMDNLINEAERYSKKWGQKITTLNLSGHGIVGGAGAQASKSWINFDTLTPLQRKRLTTILADNANLYLWVCEAASGQKQKDILQRVSVDLNICVYGKNGMCKSGSDGGFFDRNIEGIVFDVMGYFYKMDVGGWKKFEPSKSKKCKEKDVDIKVFGKSKKLLLN